MNLQVHQSSQKEWRQFNQNLSFCTLGNNLHSGDLLNSLQGQVFLYDFLQMYWGPFFWTVLHQTIHCIYTEVLVFFAMRLTPTHSFFVKLDNLRYYSCLKFTYCCCQESICFCSWNVVLWFWRKRDFGSTPCVNVPGIVSGQHVTVMCEAVLWGSTATWYVSEISEFS